MRTIIIAATAAVLASAAPALAQTASIAPQNTYAALLTEAIGSDTPGYSVAKANEAIRYEPALAEAYVIKAIGLMELSRYTEAEQALQDSLVRRPTWAKAWMLLGHTRYSDGRPDLAVEAFLQADKYQPRDAFVLRGLGESYMELEKYPQATRSFEAAVKADAKDVAAQSGLGRAHLKQKQYRKAASAFRTVLAREPGHEDASIGLIISLSRSGDKAGAKQAMATYSRVDRAAAELVGHSEGLL